MKIRWDGKALSKRAAKALLDGGEEWMRAEVLPEADENCPIDHGVMIGSHTVERVGNSAVRIGYGGPASEYVIVQHEDTTLNHPRGTSKWLENAWKKKLSSLPGILKEHMRAL